MGRKIRAIHRWLYLCETKTIQNNEPFHSRRNR